MFAPIDRLRRYPDVYFDSILENGSYPGVNPENLENETLVFCSFEQSDPSVWCENHDGSTHFMCILDIVVFSKGSFCDMGFRSTETSLRSNIQDVQRTLWTLEERHEPYVSIARGFVVWCRRRFLRS